MDEGIPSEGCDTLVPCGLATSLPRITVSLKMINSVDVAKPAQTWNAAGQQRLLPTADIFHCAFPDSAYNSFAIF